MTGKQLSTFFPPAALIVLGHKAFGSSGLQQASIGLEQIDEVAQKNQSNSQECAVAAKDPSERASLMQRVLGASKSKGGSGFPGHA